MTGKRVVFTGGTGKAGRHILPHLKSKGYDLLKSISSRSVIPASVP